MASIDFQTPSEYLESLQQFNYMNTLEMRRAPRTATCQCNLNGHPALIEPY